MVIKPSADALPDHGCEEHHIPAQLPPSKSSDSFWHSQPSEFLLGHRTTPDLPREADVVIVGSGITGASIALFLAELYGSGAADQTFSRKSKVVMLDAREACWGATGRNGGHLQPLVYNRSADIGKFELENCRYVAKYIEDNKIPCEYRSVAGCKTFWSEETWSSARQAVEKLRQDHPDLGDKITVVDGSDVEAMKSHRLRDGCKGATVTEGAASLWPYKYVTWILERLVKEDKLHLQTNTPVLKISPAKKASPPHATDGTQQWTLNTPRGSITTRNVVLATNGWTTALLPHLSDLIVPVRGTMTALLPCSTGTGVLLPNSYGFQAAGPNPEADSEEYLTQRPYSGVKDARGHFMFGGGRVYGKLPTRHVSDDCPVDEDTVSYLQRVLPTLLDVGKERKDHVRPVDSGPLCSDGGGAAAGGNALELVKSWSGIMGYSRDSVPWVGALPGMMGVWLCCGYTGHGMPNATLCARALVKMMDMSGALYREDHGREAEPMSAHRAGCELVHRLELPAAYLITEHRMQLARRLPCVAAQDATGVPRFLEKADVMKACQMG